MKHEWQFLLSWQVVSRGRLLTEWHLWGRSEVTGCAVEAGRAALARAPILAGVNTGLVALVWSRGSSSEDWLSPERKSFDETSPLLERDSFSVPSYTARLSPLPSSDGTLLGEMQLSSILLTKALFVPDVMRLA